MKFLLLFFIFMVIAFQWRQSRKPKVRQARKRPAEATMDMPACAHCGMHIPAAEAIAGRDAVYCSTAHRQAREP